MQMYSSICGEMEKDPDTTFVYSLMELHQNTENYALRCMLNNLSHWRRESNEDPLVSAAETFFSWTPTFTYSVKATVDHRKCYREYLEKSL